MTVLFLEAEGKFTRNPVIIKDIKEVTERFLVNV